MEERARKLKKVKQMELTAARAERNRAVQRPSARRRKVLFETVLPELEKRGIPREKLMEVLVDNPCRYFAD